MIARPRPEPDDTPQPELTTPRRVAAELLAIATRASQLRIQTQSLAIYLAPVEPDGIREIPHGILQAVGCKLGEAIDTAVRLASAIRVGQVLLDERYLDPSCRPERPLLDAIEARPTLRAAEAIAPAVAARGDTAPGFTEVSCTTVEIGASEPIRIPHEHPAAGPARAAARRRKGGVS